MTSICILPQLTPSEIGNRLQENALAAEAGNASASKPYPSGERETTHNHQDTSNPWRSQAGFNLCWFSKQLLLFEFLYPPIICPFCWNIQSYLSDSATGSVWKVEFHILWCNVGCAKGVIQGEIPGRVAVGLKEGSVHNYVHVVWQTLQC